ncbi:MAG: polysaccharide biosynthesis/export family protein [Planctomycetota bacterium]|jgi:polysaccharide export outer membrane protein
MKKTQVLTITFSLSVLCIGLAGCGDNFWDPTQIGRFRPVPAMNVILDSLGVADETPSMWEQAEDPKPIDIITYETDYVFSPGDFVRISIFELYAETFTYTENFIVTETGKISIPDVGVVEAQGLTESELEEHIKDILAPTILKEPSVTVTMLNSQQRTFSILGQGVPNPGRYSIPRYDYRLTDALAEAHVATQFNISYVYVSRPITGKEAIAEPIEAEPVEPEQLIDYEQEMLEIIAPHARRQWPCTNGVNTKLIITSAEMITGKELVKESSLETQAKWSGREAIDEPIAEHKTGRVEWIFQDGRWVPVQIGKIETTGPTAKPLPEKAPIEEHAEPLKEKVPEDFDWEQISGGAPQTRVIKIPTDKLAGGDPRYNIAIRPGDSIQVPLDIIGEFLMMGNVNRTGFIEITGRPITLKMAIAAAGGLGPLAWPKRCEVVRRIGKNKEEIVMVDLDKIARGEQPDFFIKPNDLINVGTHPTARWRAVLRNAFRATYGFGFVYDRNFADRDFGTSRPIPDFLSNLF